MDIDLQNISAKIAIINKIASIIVVKEGNSDDYDSLIHSVKNKSTYNYTRLKGSELILNDVTNYLRLSEYFKSISPSNFEQMKLSKIEDGFKKLCDIIKSLKEKLPKLKNQPVESVNKQFTKLVNTINKLNEKAKL